VRHRPPVRRRRRGPIHIRRRGPVRPPQRRHPRPKALPRPPATTPPPRPCPLPRRRQLGPVRNRGPIYICCHRRPPITRRHPSPSEAVKCLRILYLSLIKLGLGPLHHEGTREGKGSSKRSAALPGRRTASLPRRRRRARRPTRKNGPGPALARPPLACTPPARIQERFRYPRRRRCSCCHRRVSSRSVTGKAAASFSFFLLLVISDLFGPALSHLVLGPAPGVLELLMSSEKPTVPRHCFNSPPSGSFLHMPLIQ
jgi:hypothetical protein